MSTPTPTDPSFDYDSPDVDTAELPVLNEELLDLDFDFDVAGRELETESRPQTDHSGEQATAWMHQMKAEIESLRERWNEVDGDLKVSAKRIAELEAIVLEKDASLQQLTTDLQLALDERTEFRTRLTESEGLLDQLNTQVEEQAAANDASASANKELEDLCAKLKGKLKDNAQENEKLNQSIRSQLEQISVLEAEVRNFDKTTNAARTRTHELECYIDSRKSHWTEQEAALSESRHAQDEMTKVIRLKDEQLAAQDKEEKALGKKIVGLENEVAQLVGRLEERDDAFSKVQERLQDQISVAERLRSEITSRKEELDEARKEITNHTERVSAYEEEIRQKDSETERLQGAANEQALRIDELTEENEVRSREIAQLGETIAEREAAIKGLQSQCEEAEATLTETRARLAEIEETRSQLMLDNAEQLDASRELQTELSNANQDREELTDQFASANETIESLREKLGAAEERESSLESRIIILHEQIEQLQNDIMQKQEVIDAFDSGARALNDLNRDMRDFAIDSVRSPDQARMKKVSNLFENFPSDNTGFEATVSDAEHMLVVLSKGKRPVVHKLTRDLITIGRGGQCDIILNEASVSRIHARLIRCESGFEIEDADSTNGVLVNKRRVERAVLRHGDIISVAGLFHLKFL